MTPEYFSNNNMMYSDEEWKSPISLAILIHIFFFALLIFPPSFLLPDRTYPDIQSINLFTVKEFEQIQNNSRPAPPKPVPAKPQAAPKPINKEPAPVIEKDVKSIALPPEPALTEPGKIVSLNPRKLKKKLPPPKENITDQNEQLRLKALDRIKARINQKKEEEQIKHKLSQLRDKLLSDNVKPEPEAPPVTDAAPVADAPATQGPAAADATKSTDSSAMAGPSTGQASILQDFVKKQYLGSLHRKVMSNWVLPETQNWDKEIESIVVVVVQKSGIVSKTFFEKKSKNKLFDQYVEKALRDSEPFPPFPSSFKESRIEIGFRFTPGGLY